MTTAKNSTQPSIPASSSTPATTAPSSVVPSTLQPLTSTSTLQHAPSAPNGFTPLTKEEMGHLAKMTQGQRINVAPVAAEIDDSTTYTQDFGVYAPSQADVVGLLTCAAALIAESANATRWARYITGLTAVTVDAALGAVGTMGQGLDYALQHNPALAATYPLLLAFVQTRSEVISKGLAAKKAAEKKAAKVAATPTVAAPVVASAPAVSALAK